MSTYTWKITDVSLVQQMKNAKNKSKWKSSTFSVDGFRWFLGVYPNGLRENQMGFVDLVLYLACLPPKVKSIQIGYELRLIETDTEYIATYTFDKDKMGIGWYIKQLQTKEIQNLSTLTFTAKIEVCGVFDHEDNDITNNYVSTVNEEAKHSQLQYPKQSDLKLIEVRLDSLTNSMDKMMNSFLSFEQRVTDLEERINDEQKENTGDTLNKLMAEIKVIKQDLRTLSSNVKMNPKQLELKAWLENKVGFPQYYDTFIENGIEDLSVASLLTMESITSMGISKIGHQMKILQAVGKINDTTATENIPPQQIIKRGNKKRKLNDGINTNQQIINKKRKLNQ